jgi:hypothetical protein
VTLHEDSLIQGNILGQNAYVEKCELGIASKIINNEFENDGNIFLSTIGAEAEVDSNSLGNNATIRGTELGCNASLISNTLGAGSVINKVVVANDKTLSNKTLDPAVTIEDKTFNLSVTVVETLTANLTGSVVSPALSDIPKTIDITGLTTLDCLAYNDYVGIFNLTSSNATEALTDITNFPTRFDFVLRPAAGLVLTVTGTAIAGIVSGKFALTTASAILDGDNGDYIVLRRDANAVGYAEEVRRVILV